MPDDDGLLTGDELMALVDDFLVANAGLMMSIKVTESRGDMVIVRALRCRGIEALADLLEKRAVLATLAHQHDVVLVFINVVLLGGTMANLKVRAADGTEIDIDDLRGTIELKTTHDMDASRVPVFVREHYAEMVASKARKKVWWLPAGAKREAIRRQNLRARLLGNQWAFKLVLRLWADGLSYRGITSAVARQEVADAFHANHVDPRTAISHLTSTQARNILATLQNRHDGCRASIMQSIISLLKNLYLPVYHDSPYLPFTQRHGDKTSVSPITPTQEILIGLETVAVEALDVVRRGIKVGKVKGGGVEKHWNALHGLLTSEPGAVDAVRGMLDRLIDLLE